jgi:DNA-binding response OmpR family regulator
MTKRTILIVDDDRHLSRLVQLQLSEAGYAVWSAADGKSAMRQIRDRRPDLVILDVKLPDTNGLSVCGEIRSLTEELPILMLSAMGADHDRIVGLEVGADDYLGKPYNPRELLARVRALLRRALRARRDPAETLQFETLTLNPHTHEALLDGDSLHLTPTEFQILECLVRRQGGTVRRSELVETVWGPAFSDSPRILDTHVRNLRAKLVEPAPQIAVVRGVGFKMQPWDGHSY